MRELITNNNEPMILTPTNLMKVTIEHNNNRDQQVMREIYSGLNKGVVYSNVADRYPPLPPVGRDNQ